MTYPRTTIIPGAFGRWVLKRVTARGLVSLQVFDSERAAIDAVLGEMEGVA